LKGDARLTPMAFRPVNQLPEKLPDGAHRVISEMTSAKMRAMMQGIVVEGTGKNAALNGYSAGGKTGTAQKVDAATHTYSHTKLVASFAGFAPVSNPAISVAVVIDNPTAGGDVSHYGGATSAPVFAEVAQQVLEYLGVPHDQPLKTKKELQQIAKSDTAGDGPVENGADVEAMLAEVNDLPADDPLRAAPPIAAARIAAPAKQAAGIKLLPAKVLAAFHDGGLDGGAERVKAAPAAPRPVSGVVMDAGERVAVPSFTGGGLRAVVVQAAAAGLRVQPVGSGVAREQAPAAGTMVPQGSEVVVRFLR
jgi:cell division protein FtsI (penicillin-binding protein 3)